MLCMPFPAILATAFSCACHSCQGIARTRKHSQVLRQHLREQCCNHMDGVMILQAIGDALMDEHNVAQVARPGTSLTRPATGAAAVSQNTLAGAAAHNMQALQSAIACPLHGRAVGSVIAGVHMAFISKCCAQLTTIHHRPAQDMNRCQHDQHVCRLDLPLQRSCLATLPQHELRLSCTCRVAHLLQCGRCHQQGGPSQVLCGPAQAQHDQTQAAAATHAQHSQRP